MADFWAATRDTVAKLKYLLGKRKQVWQYKLYGLVFFNIPLKLMYK
jgi:hypothetical protein